MVNIFNLPMLKNSYERFHEEVSEVMQNIQRSSKFSSWRLKFKAFVFPEFSAFLEFSPMDQGILKNLKYWNIFSICEILKIESLYLLSVSFLTFFTEILYSHDTCSFIVTVSIFLLLLVYDFLLLMAKILKYFSLFQSIAEYLQVSYIKALLQHC